MWTFEAMTMERNRNTDPLRQALHGLVVADFTQIVAGPLCTMLLADMGADVIKVESPEGDLGRTLGPGWVGDDSALYYAFNRNKRGLCLDLKSPEGLEVARRLVARADVVIESMRPGVMERLGLGYEAVSAINPRVVYCSISAYGQAGPYAGRAGVDGILQADSGLMSLIGVPGAEPCKVQAPVVDMMTGYVASMAVLAGLRARDANGRGQHLDVNLLNSALSLQQASLASYLADGVSPERIGSAAPYSAPNEAFECADGWLMIAAYQGNRWARLCDVLGLPALATDPRFATSARRVQHREAMSVALTRVLKTRTTGEWLTLLETADILCARVATFEDTVGHPQVAQNGMLVGTVHPVFGEIRAPGFPVNSATANADGHAVAPARGEHGLEILEELAFDEDGVTRLIGSGKVLV